MNHTIRDTNLRYTIRDTQYAIRTIASTLVENPLQINLFMQNKPNLPDTQMNLSNVEIMNYKKTNLALSEVEWANSNPNKPNLRKAKINVNSYVIEDYRKNDDFVVRINKPNFCKAQNERKRFFTKGL